MPGFDGTGPRRMGPMTGGGRGLCSPFGMRAVWRPYGARSWARYGYEFDASPSRKEELDFLKSESPALKRTLEGIDARIKELVGEVK